MFTWNFQYISRSRLAETFDQLMLDTKKGDILIRIHTAIHDEEEAVELARFVAKLVPGAHIFGTSTSAVICWGKLISNQCVVSVTQMNGGSIRTAMLPTFSEGGVPISPDVLSQNVKQAVVGDDTKLMLTFLTGKYLDVYSFVESCNDCFPGVQMIGGLANTSEINLKNFVDSGFVFNENGWSNKSIIAAAISGERFESTTSYATGVQTIGEELEITDTFLTCILSVNGKDAASQYRLGIGDELRANPELTNLFPYVYSDASDIPIYENSNMCGCITEGEIAHVNGRNTFANCSFVVSAMGEGEFTQKYNPYVFSHTDSLMADNTDLLNYLYEIENRFADSEHSDEADSLRQLVKDMRDSFAAVGIEDIVIKRHGALGLNTEAYSIDGDISKLPDEFGWH